MAFVVTVDGPAGAGKSTVARRVAKHVGIRYLDTGALYRAIAYYLDKKNIPAEENEDLSRAVALINVRLDNGAVFVNDENVTESIRSTRVDGVVSSYAALRTVRDSLLDMQQSQANYGDLIVDGRDTGTVVFPKADVKFFLTASAEARAERRYRELLKKGEAVVYKEILARIHERDRSDRNREIAPLREPKGAIHVDTSQMSEDEVVNELSFIVRRAMD